MKTLLALAILILAIPNATMTAQGLPAGLTMTCTTSDGIVVISEQALTIADYRLQLQDIPADGFAVFVDPVSNTSAVLDARSDDGLYIEVREGTIRMQVIAARDAIVYSFSPKGIEPASPSMSARVMEAAARPPLEK